MSGENRDLYYHDTLFRDRSTFAFLDDLTSILRPSGTLQDLNSFDHQITSFTDYSSLNRAFELSGSPPIDVFFPGRDGEKPMGDMVVVQSSAGGGADGGTPLTANSSVSVSSSSEAVGEEDSGRCKEEIKEEVQEQELEQEQEQPKGCEDVGDNTKKVNKPRKKGEKRQRVARFAFMTKSEVDHLEDGYRWRKYGQKAVKNSPYPRSYYRCTTQKCSVKKRVERSYEDPTIVITTYEGQHIHHSPATTRSGSHMLAPPPPSSSFHQEMFMHHVHPLNHNGHQSEMNPSMFLQNFTTPLHQLQLQDYGLLQDIVPSFMNPHQP